MCTEGKELGWRRNMQPECVSCDALGHGGGAQTVPLVKQRLQNSQNVWNSPESHIVRLPKQIKAAACEHM